MTPNILLCAAENELEKFAGDDFVAHIDGKLAVTLRQFYEQIADVLEFPHFGFNLDALNDALNDLQWLEDIRIILYITNTNDLISKERDPDKIGSILNILDATAEDWKWIEDDEVMEAKELIVVFDDSPRIRKLLAAENIDYKLMSEIV